MRRRCLSILDTVLALVVIFPFALAYWRGIWDLLDYYVLPGKAPLRYWVYIGIGHLQIIGLMVLPYLDKTLDRSKKVRFWIITRIFLIINSVFFMTYWEGVWVLLNYYFGTDWEYSLPMLLFSWTVLGIFNGFRSLLWPPFIVGVDGQSDMLICQNKFKSKVPDDGWRNYVADVYFSHFIIWAMSISCFRSIMNILDRLVVPGDKLASDSLSATIGLAVSVLLLSLQIPLSKVYSILSDRGYIVLRLLWWASVHAVTFVCVAFLWRGTWNLSVSYVIPQKPLGPWISFAAGTVGLLLLQSQTSMVLFGMVEDIVDTNEDAFYKIKYLRIFLKDYIEKEELYGKPDGDSDKLDEKLVNLSKEDKSYSSLIGS